jgi:enoyl-CoA hydratase
MTQEYADGKMLADSEDGVGLITFNQPAKRNAMSVEMWQGLEEILTAFEEDPEIRVVVLTGAGHQAFVSGADISQFDTQRGDSAARVEYDRRTQSAKTKLEQFSKPVIARIRGFCMGGGLGIALQADIRIAAVDSEFGIPAARLGVAYGLDATRRLVNLVGPANAQMMLMTGSRIDAQEAQRIGLVNQVVPDEELTETVLDLARRIADNAPLSVRAAKLTVIQSTLADPDAAAVEKAIAGCFDSEDYKEGRRAFTEKRAPQFNGK